MSGGSCSACLHIAARRGVRLGDRVQLRAGHVGRVAVISHFDGDVGVLVHDDAGRETVMLSLEAATDRGSEAA